MEDLHARVLAAVPRVHVAHDGGPLGRRVVQLPAGALAVPPADGPRAQAACRLAAELGGGGKHVGVCGSHDLLYVDHSASVSHAAVCESRHGEGSLLTVIIAPEDSPVT